MINTHYIHNVVVQDFVSGQDCSVNQYHYESWKQQVVMRFVHTTGKTWYKVLYHHTMYVISLSNISIKTNNNGRNNINKFVQHSEGDYILCMTSRLFVAVHSIALSTLLTLTFFTPHSNDMTSLQNSSAENITCNVAPFFYHHSVVIQHLVSDTLYQTCYFL
jgi:hypothetical protein